MLTSFILFSSFSVWYRAVDWAGCPSAFEHTLCILFLFVCMFRLRLRFSVCGVFVVFLNCGQFFFCFLFRIFCVFSLGFCEFGCYEQCSRLPWRLRCEMTYTHSPGELGNFVDGHGTLSCVITLCSCFYNIISNRKCDELFWIIWIGFLLFVLLFLNWKYLHVRCLQGKAPQYLVNCCHPTSDVTSRQRLQSSSRHHLVVPQHRRSALGCRAFCIAGPIAWNALPDDLRDPLLSADNFRKTLKTHPFRNALGHLAH